MHPLAVIRATPLPSLPVVVASIAMIVAYLAADSAQGAAINAVAFAVFARLALQFALKLPQVLAAAARPGPAGIGPSLLLTAMGLTLAAVLWLNDTTSAQAIWSGILLATGALGLWHVLRDLDRGPGSGDAALERHRVRIRASLALQSVNQVVFAMAGAVLAVTAPEPVWVLYAGLGWLMQSWMMGWVWTAWRWSAGR